MNAVSQPQRYLINVEQYHKMGAAGVFPEGTRVELIEGELLSMAPMGTPHVWAVAALTRALIESPLGRHVFLLPQLPVVLSDISEPQPDIALARLPADKYRKARVTPADIVLLIEVSDSTLGFDRQRKMQLYARHAVPEYWILNVQDRQLEVHRAPEGGAYGSVQVVPPGTPVSLAAFPDVAFDWSVALD
ncbi:MAG: Uma2 family endonuclease [Steroidobacteraceae bacterium]|jgi:Uma2 family endonuclease|nr:Uma2 family endonuclease [Steroidobacteraceae bacterium]